jgi:TonB family protein
MPVAVEISVTATGAKPPEGSGERQLFTEETSTVLVLPDGAVIRLAAAVTQSQLIFLTNNTTKREVVCQVLRKRSYRPTSCYVELQFTEAAADFWGVDFLTEETVSGAGAGSETQEEVAAAEAIVEEPAVAVTAPSDKEVLQLREEVEALRNQLQSLMVKKEEPAVAPAAPKIDISQAVQIARDLAAGSEVKAKSEKKKEIAEAGAESEEDSMEHLLPEVELDFSRVPTKMQDEGLAGPNGKAPLVGTGKFLRVGGLVLVLAGILIGAWYENWLPILKKSAEPAAGANGGVVVAKPAKAGGPSATPAVNSVSGNAVGSAAGTKEGNSGAADSSADASDAVKVENTENNLAAARKDSGTKDLAGKTSKKRGAEKADAKPMEVAPDASADGAVITPAKLVQPVNPVYPPDAMRNYITGDVKLDAVVEADGRMGAMSVLSGPAPLRGAAIEALKKYKYAPAMQNGKGVTSHVKVTIKFWFDP